MADSAPLDSSGSALRVLPAYGGTGISYYLHALGIHNWSDLAALLTAIYSACLIIDWLYRRWKVWKP